MSNEYDPTVHNARIEFRTFPNGSYTAVLLVDGAEEPVMILAALCGNFAKHADIKDRFHSLINDAMRLDIQRYGERN